MSKFILSTAVIQSLCIAREVQLQDVPPNSRNVATLARVAFNNGARTEFNLEWQKLKEWAATFSSRDLSTGLLAELIPDENRFRIQLGGSEIIFESQNKNSVDGTNCIEVEIQAGCARKVVSRDPELHKQAKKVIARQRGIEKRQREIERIGAALASEHTNLETWNTKVRDAVTFIARTSVVEAVENRLLVRQRRNTKQRILKALAAGKDPIPALTDLVVITPENTGGVKILVDKWQHALKRELTYKPQNTYSHTAREERERRGKTCQQAERRLESQIHWKLIDWINAVKTEAGALQEQRKIYRMWPKMKAEIQLEIDLLEIELSNKRQQLSEYIRQSEPGQETVQPTPF